MYRDSGRNSICHLLKTYSREGGKHPSLWPRGFWKCSEKPHKILGVSTWQQRLYSISTRVILHHQPSTAAYATFPHSSSCTSRVYSRAFADYCIHVFSHSVYGTKGLNFSCERDAGCSKSTLAVGRNLMYRQSWSFLDCTRAGILLSILASTFKGTHRVPCAFGDSLIEVILSLIVRSQTTLIHQGVCVTQPQVKSFLSLHRQQRDTFNSKKSAFRSLKWH